jgi:hypothetical protein
MAHNAKEAMRLEKFIKVDEVWIDEDWKKQQPDIGTDVGFVKKKKRCDN